MYVSYRDVVSKLGHRGRVGGWYLWVSTDGNGPAFWDAGVDGVDGAEGVGDDFVVRKGSVRAWLESCCIAACGGIEGVN